MTSHMASLWYPLFAQYQMNCENKRKKSEKSDDIKLDGPESEIQYNVSSLFILP